MAMNMKSLFTVFLLIIIGLSLTPTIQEQVTDITGVGGTNLTGSARAMALLIPLFWVVGLLAIGVASIYIAFSGAGGKVS